MCDYSVVARPRNERAQKDEELTLVNLENHSSQHVVRGFASPANLFEPVCMMPRTQLRVMGAEIERHRRLVPWEGEAEFVQVDLEDPHTTHDALKFPGNMIVKLVDLKPGLQARVLSVPVHVEPAPADKLVETPAPAIQTQAAEVAGLPVSVRRRASRTSLEGPQ